MPTPLIQISEKIYAKLETYQPTGSVKDRMATYILNDAEDKGLIKKGDTLIEATSGNTGIAFSMLAAQRGYKMKIVMPCNMSEERKQMLKYSKSRLIRFDQNINLKSIFDGDLKAWPLYFTPNILPSKNNKVFYIGDAFNGFLPTLAQGAGQSIESAFELFNLIKDNKPDTQNIYFRKRSKRAIIIRKRSNLNFFVFHFSSSIMQKIRNIFMKFLVKRKSFINYYLGSIYRN